MSMASESKLPIDQLLSTLTDKDSLQDYCYAGLTPIQKLRLKSQRRQVYQGKVREVIEGEVTEGEVTEGEVTESKVTEGSHPAPSPSAASPDHSHSSEPYLLINHTDRLTAFDCFIDNSPLKGQILAAFSEFWFRALPPQIPHHFIERVHPRVLKTRKCQPIKIEVVVRNYLAGSMLRSYQAGERSFCGHRLPDGLKPFEKLPEPIITPTTKAEVFEHDQPITATELIEQKIVTLSDWQCIERLAHQLFSFGSKLLSASGYLLVDTKYEFGISTDHQILVIDEIHTPDSSRFWLQSSYFERFQEGKTPEMFDKEMIRTWLIEHGFTGYGPVPEVPASKLIELAQSYYYLYTVVSGKQEFAEPSHPEF